MKSVLLLATTTGYQIRAFGQAAEKLGVRLVFASDRCDQLEDPWWDHAIPVRFHQVSRSATAVLTALRSSPPDGIVAVGDRPVVLAARLNKALGLPGHPPAAAEASRNKRVMRDALRAARLPTPWFITVPTSADATAFSDVPYPAVIKPLALAGSRGVMRVDTKQELLVAFERLCLLLWSPDVRLERDEAHDIAMIESFIPGQEFALEGILERGRLRTLAIFDKPDPLDGPFFEETIYATPSQASVAVQERIEAAVAAAATAIGLYHGPVHAECRVNDEGVYVLEVAARPIGGLCSRALRFEPGQTSLEELLLRHALGEDVSRFSRERDASAVMMIPIPKKGVYRGVEGVTDAAAVPGIESIEITAKPDAMLVPLPEGRSYLGFIFAHAAQPEEAVGALRQAHGRLRFMIDREVVMV